MKKLFTMLALCAMAHFAAVGSVDPPHQNSTNDVLKEKVSLPAVAAETFAIQAMPGADMFCLVDESAAQTIQPISINEVSALQNGMRTGFTADLFSKRHAFLRRTRFDATTSSGFIYASNYKNQSELYRKPILPTIRKLSCGGAGRTC